MSRSMSDRDKHWATTRWTLLQALDGQQTSMAQEALTHLCETYWYPLYAFVRARGHNQDEASDLVQGFLADLIERGSLGSVHPERGRFRAFLLASVKHYLANQRAKANAGKRGGGQVTLPLEFDLAEQRYQHEPVDTVSPDTLYERAWASAVIETVLRRIQVEWTARGKSSEFDRLRETLTGDSPSEGYAAIAVELGTTEPALRVAAHRLKRRFLTELRAEVADLSSPADVDEELRYLVHSLGS